MSAARLKPSERLSLYAALGGGSLTLSAEEMKELAEIAKRLEENDEKIRIQYASMRRAREAVEARDIAFTSTIYKVFIAGLAVRFLSDVALMGWLQ